MDLGCGLGHNSIIINGLYPRIEIHGLDIMDTNQLPNYVQFKQVDLDKDIFSYPNDYFDAILFSHVIEHLKNPLDIGSEINGVFKKMVEYILKQLTGQHY